MTVRHAAVPSTNSLTYAVDKDGTAHLTAEFFSGCVKVQYNNMPRELHSYEDFLDAYDIDAFENTAFPNQVCDECVTRFNRHYGVSELTKQATGPSDDPLPLPEQAIEHDFTVYKWVVDDGDSLQVMYTHPDASLMEVKSALVGATGADVFGHMWMFTTKNSINRLGVFETPVSTLENHRVESDEYEDFAASHVTVAEAVERKVRLGGTLYFIYDYATPHRIDLTLKAIDVTLPGEKSADEYTVTTDGVAFCDVEPTDAEEMGE